MLNQFRKRVHGVIRHEVHWRCREAVVVIESDDWGLPRRPVRSELEPLGTPSEWADESMEKATDLTQLFHVLKQVRDGAGRPACLTANVITGQPDIKRMQDEAFEAYRDTSSLSEEPLLAAYQRGQRQHTIRPQYHGRAHFHPETFLEDLRENREGARQLASQEVHGGRSLLQGEGWRYHSEYLPWSQGDLPKVDQLKDWMEGGLAYFEQVFGFRPATMIAPHYILPGPAIKAWSELGGRAIQGADYRIMRQANGEQYAVSQALGETSPQGLTFLIRTAKFEPARPNNPNQLGQTIARIVTNLHDHIPVVIDSHRINYTGTQGAKGRDQLGKLLKSLQSFDPLFLTSEELAEAIANHGRFHDAFTGAKRSLTPLPGFTLWRERARSWFSDFNNHRLRGY